LRIIGIDPGLSGAIASVHQGAITKQPAPIVTINGKRHFDEAVMRSILLELTRTSPVRAVMENVHAMPGQGVVSMFRFGMGFGIWRGLLRGLDIEYVTVEPSVWKRYWNLLGQDKAASRAKANELTSLDFSRPKDEGMAEAVLIALYGSDQYLGASRAAA
jgi:crossover junction endodeoxyribonuclease RuvC